MFNLVIHSFLLICRTDKWAAKANLGTKWGDKWEENFFSGIGSRHGETWHLSPTGERKTILFLVHNFSLIVALAKSFTCPSILVHFM